MSTPDSSTQPNIEISDDRLTVTLKKAASQDHRLTPAELLAMLVGHGIDVADPHSINALAGEDGTICASEDIVLLEGKPPKSEEPSALNLLVHPPDGPEATNYYERSTYLNTQPGQIIARIRPITPGIDGVDVFGKPIPYEKAPPPDFTLGENVATDADGVTVRATVVGRISQKDAVLSVSLTLEIPGDVDFRCGNITVAGDIQIRGSILDLFKVKGANIEVGGAIEAAEVSAEHNLLVNGGIIGKDKGRCTAAGDVACRYASNATIIAGGNVVSHGEMAHTRVICGGRLTIERGPLTSGHVTANGGAECRVLGAHGKTKVLLEVGFDDALRCNGKARLDAIRVQKDKTLRVRTEVSKILQNPKILTEAQKKQAAALLQNAAEAEKRTDELLKQLRDALAASKQKSCAEVVVQEILHAGATIRFPMVETTIISDWKGPLRLIPQQDEDSWQVLLIDIRTNSSQILPSRPWHDTAFETFQREIAA